MKTRHTVVASVLSLATAATLGVVTYSHFPTRDPQLYPDPSLTPGLVATSDYKELTKFTYICPPGVPNKVAGTPTCTYSEFHRLTSSKLKTLVAKEYPINCATSAREIDHLIPLALGGADDAKNLWCQPEHVVVNGEDLGFHTKDKLETYMVSQMKGGNISPTDAQQCIVKDWVACYHQHFNNTFGGVGEVADPDTQ